MTKREILRIWLDEPRTRYSSKSNIVLGYGDGWEHVKDTLRPSLGRNATFLIVLGASIKELNAYLVQKSSKKNWQEEDYTLYAHGYRDGVRDALAAISGRFEKAS